MKAILVFDMPATCTDCPCYDYIHGVCANTHKNCELRIQEKPTWCPLKPLPCKKYMRQMPSGVLEKDKRKRDFIIHKVDVDNSYVEGWNDCLEEIEGETE